MELAAQGVKPHRRILKGGISGLPDAARFFRSVLR
jgi:hypothetical protein